MKKINFDEINVGDLLLLESDDTDGGIIWQVTGFLHQNNNSQQRILEFELNDGASFIDYDDIDDILSVYKRSGDDIILKWKKEK